MKSIITFLFLTFLCTQFCFAQPDEFNYQTVVRNGQSQLITNQEVSFRMTIHSGSANGTEVYQETHSAETNDHGLVSLRIGAGSSSDDLSEVNWAGSTHFLEVEVDPTGGNNYEEMGTTQLMSVPYALHAKSVVNSDDADADPSNEIQELSLDGDVLSISGGNSVSLGGEEVVGEAVAKAWVNFPIVGTPNLAFDAYNVTSTSVVTTGVRIVSLPPSLFSTATNPACVCQIRNDLAPGFCTVVSGSSPSQVTVRTYNAAGELADKEFSLVIFGK